MYQSVIRDPGGNNLIRIQPDVCGQYSAIVNGSILIVPPGTIAYVVINGILSRPYEPGRYEIFTGVDPFFVRFRNMLTHGDAGISVSVFFISVEKIKLIKLGTGEFPFREHRFQLTMKALASCSLSFSISDPLKILNKMVGSYSSAFSEDDIEPYLKQLILTPIREGISREITKLDITEFNSNLSHIGNMTASTIKSGLSEYGIRMERFDLMAIHVPDSEMQRLHVLEQEYACGKTRTDLELDNLQRVWKGNVYERTLGEMMSGISSRAQSTVGTANGNACSNVGGMTPMMMQMMMFSQLFPSLRDPLVEMTRHTDMFSRCSSDAQGSTSSAEASPPIPKRYKHCPSCNGNVLRGNSVCPICGYRFGERSE